MQTICKECIFAEVRMDEYQHYAQQLGCKFDDRLSKYKELNLAHKIDGNWYYTINTLCRACTKINVGQTLPDDFVEIVRKNISPKVDAVVYGDDENIKKTLLRIKDDGYNKIIVCQPNLNSQRLYTELVEIYPRIIISSQIENNYELEFLDSGCLKSKADYLAIVSNEEVPNIPQIIYNLVMNELSEFVAILPENDLHGMVITPRAFKFLGGNFNTLIKDKITQIANYESKTLQWKNLK